MVIKDTIAITNLEDKWGGMNEITDRIPNRDFDDDLVKNLLKYGAETCGEKLAKPLLN